MSSGIYKLYFLNKPNKIYIGQAKDLNIRRKEHLRKLKSGRHYNNHLQNSFNKYGESSIIYEIIELCELSYLDDKEIFYINKYNSIINGYNLKSGGQRGELSDESKVKSTAKRFENGHIKIVYAFSSKTGEYIGEYKGYRAASNMLNVGESNIRQIVSGKMKSAKGFHFSLTNKSPNQVCIDVISKTKSEEYKKNHSILFSGINNPMYGKKRPDTSGVNNPYSKLIKSGFQPKRKIKITVDDIISLHKLGLTQKEISLKAECTQVTISTILLSNNIRSTKVRRKAEAKLYFS